MKLRITKYSLISLLLMVSFSLSAQKEVRQNIRKGTKHITNKNTVKLSVFINRRLKKIRSQRKLISISGLHSTNKRNGISQLNR